MINIATNYKYFKCIPQKKGEYGEFYYLSSNNKYLLLPFLFPKPFLVMSR